MNAAAPALYPSEAARRLGVSVKALRLYERRGLLTPGRTASGWRVYGADAMARAAEIVSLRGLGLSLGQVARVLEGDAEDLEPALAEHQAMLESQLRRCARDVEKVGRLRAGLAAGRLPKAGELAGLTEPPSGISVAFDLPWPWGGELFELRDIRPLTYIVGPLGCGKTRFAMRLAESLPEASFFGLERLAEDGAEARARLASDPALKARVDRALAWLVEEGAAVSGALVALLAGLEGRGAAILVVDMVEQGLDKATQEALIAWLRRRAPERGPLFLLTRSNAILDLDALGAGEAIIFCPANHSPPSLVAPYRGASGYEGVATCLASPEVRARTEGVIAWRPLRA